jgi:uncharacterized protein
MLYLRWSWLPLLIFLNACVTINVYFPATEAERAADKIIDKVWGEETETQQPQSSLPLLYLALNLFLPEVQAQGFNLDISSPAIQAIQNTMQQRHQQLEAYYDNGAIGLSMDGLIILREPNQIPLRLRNEINKQINDENNDRLALYKEIAIANRQPQWENQIREVFSRRWIERAKIGWWYQDADKNWVRKLE